MMSRVVRTNQYDQDLGLIHSTNGNHLESPNEGSSIDHQVTIYLHAQNITMFPTNETWYFASQILVSSSGDLILILTAQSTRNMFRIHRAERFLSLRLGPFFAEEEEPIRRTGLSFFMVPSNMTSMLTTSSRVAVSLFMLKLTTKGSNAAGSERRSTSTDSSCGSVISRPASFSTTLLRRGRRAHKEDGLVLLYGSLKHDQHVNHLFEGGCQLVHVEVDHKGVECSG
ncbi:RNA polymerase II C-terminal domain phosphatase-like 4-like [Dorcoceras hygrometricum]|uniref:RNA polymerase II C-terminal domain phosphatase-like 4-like n=1 Tax=Dorcoceras hygrometricum TaxID=472368 RepID=A0A2Z7BE09_9LAMI|nr:RNA polymerase II C-terminal domain phosphatase-like 4-like [Dorcoceras hygrometricum]